MIQNNTIVITGASSGIGKTILEMLAAKENGNRIVAASRSIGKLSGFGDNVTLFPCDLSAQEGVDALFDAADQMNPPPPPPPRRELRAWCLWGSAGDRWPGQGSGVPPCESWMGPAVGCCHFVTLNGPFLPPGKC